MSDVLQPAYRYRAQCVRVIDGDTYVLAVDLGFRASIQFEGRLAGVNAPEVHGATKADGLAAASFVRALIAPTAYPEENLQLLVESHKDERSFARWVVDVWLPDGQSLAQILLSAGHAVVMDRG